ncbi:aspartate/glutamate racemase family protein [Planococcus lenghuensis]|uniref:Aspartate racemase n=1 Tax=Planococcus lenghuensis TaxID=2213202 RepID=A0A1Q2L2W0_9BACL|nr:amino acid racemase [Planococcus lenghuensis]AQQ54795.1 aspartate racemase [Planococcus lenghuensis]
MQKLGIIGGTGPESTVDYYQDIIQGYQEAVGSKEELPEFLIYSINMYRIFELLEAGETEKLADYLAEAVNSLHKAGAEFAVLAANTPHIVFDSVQEKTAIPLVSIVEAARDRAQELGLKKVALLGTKFTMENDFFKKPFRDAGIEITVPSEPQQQYIHEKTLSELEKGVVKSETKSEFIRIAQELIDSEGAEGIILGCTEFPMILKPDDLPVPLLNTTEIHVKKIIEAMIAAPPGK